MPATFTRKLIKTGFTVVELAVVLGVLTMVLGIAAINLTTIQHKTYLITTVDTVVADIKQQQVKAMIGDSEGRSDHSAYGIYFETDRYTLFHGNSYSPSELSNAVVMLGQNINFNSVSLPSDQVVFNGVSGEIGGYTAGSDTIGIVNTVTGESKTITINRYGAVISVN